MKSLITLSLLLSLVACSPDQSGSNVAASSSAGEDQADSLIKKYGFDKELNVNLDQFRTLAREELSKRFGKIADKGEIIQKDMVGENPGSFYDMNRLYYVVKVELDPRIINSEDLYAAYMLTTQGYSAIGYAKVTEKPRHDISWLFAGYSVKNKTIASGQVDEDGQPVRDKEKEREVLAAAVEKYSQALPSLVFTPFNFINSYFVETPKESLINPSAAQLEAFGKFLAMTKADTNIDYIEIQPEYANFMPADHVTSFGEGQGKTIDMNALRSISLTYLREGNRPVDGLVPFLPAPFGDGVEKHIEE